MTKFIFLILFFLALFNANASHIPGGVITYQYIGGNQYVVTLSLYEQCGGVVSEPSTPKTISITDSCTNTAQSFSLANIVYAQEVSDICPSSSDSSACSIGSIPGFYLHQWQSTITLNTSSCAVWNFSYTICCRNEVENLIGRSNNFYINSTLDVSNDPTNSSSNFTDLRVPSFCLNQLAAYSVGAYDPDGDELRFELVSAKQSENTFVPYASGYSGSNPIPGVAIDSLSGLITFTPSMIGIYQFAILVKELDDNGIVKASVQHDMQAYILNCTNQQPSLPIGGVSIASGSGVLIDSNIIDICSNGTVCFDVDFADLNSNDDITITSNVSQVFPGATMTVSGTNPITAQICLTTIASNNDMYYPIQLKAEDNACPSIGVNYYSVLVHVVNETKAIQDTVICGAQMAELSVVGGSTFNWSVVSGDPIVVGTNFSCDTCRDVSAMPTVTTSYEVVSNLSGCTNTDTVTVAVVPDFTYSISSSVNTLCNTDTVQFDLNSVPIGALMQIDSINGFSDAQGNSINFNNNSFIGDLTHEVFVRNSSGCVYIDTLRAEIVGIPEIVGSIQYNDTVICEFEKLEMFSSGVNRDEACTSIPLNSIASDLDIQVGMQNAANTTFSPTPFFGFYEDSKMQALYRASDLKAMGVPHFIDKLAFNVIAQNSGQPYSEFTINIGCTSDSVLNGDFISGLTNVYYNFSYSAVNGWNTFNFGNGYAWDGISNLVVQVCFNNDSWTDSDQIALSSSSYGSSQMRYQDEAFGCSFQNLANVSNVLPVVRFFGEKSSLEGYNYTWSPSSEFTYPDSNYVSISPSTNQYYYLEVTDIGGYCYSKDSIYVSFSTGGDAYFSYPDTLNCYDFGNIFADSITTPTGVFSILPVIGINSATGDIDITNAVLDVPYAVSHITSGIGRCADTSVVNVTFTGHQDPSFGYANSSYCLSDTDPLPNITVPGGTFSSPSPDIWVGNATGTIYLGSTLSGTYVIKYVTPGPCMDSSFFTVDIIDPPSAYFEFSDTLYCNSLTTVSPSLVDTPGGQFTSNTGLLINSSSGEIDLWNTPSGIHNVYYTVSGSCTSTDTLVLETYQKQVDIESLVVVNENCEAECNGSLSIFSASATAFSLDSENLGTDSTFSELCIGEHYFIIVDNNSCAQKYYFDVEFENTGNCDLVFYSGITPNNDQFNDVWIIDGLPEEGGKVTIVNRWGDEVWSSDSYDNIINVWQGNNMNGEELPAGVYFYIAEINGETYKGFIELSK